MNQFIRWYKSLNGTSKIGIYIMVFGAILIFLGLKGISFGIDFIESGRWIVPLGLALYAIGVSLDSGKKMQSISTANFYEITYRFWDRAPALYKKESFKNRDTDSWQLGNLFRHAEKLKDWADPDVQEKLIKEFKTFLERLRLKKCKKYWVEVKNYMAVCSIAIGLKTEKDTIKDELIDELSKWIGKKEKEESNREYLQRKENEFSKMEKSKIFKIIKEKAKKVEKNG